MKSFFLITRLILLCVLFSTQTFAQGGTWTWMHGSVAGGTGGNYGIKGVPAMSNEPPERYQTAYWTDKDGNFWIFGGVSNLSNEFNDMWKFDVASNMWTWVSGEKNNINSAGVYGTKGIPSINNYPSARGWGVNCWTDNNGDLWLFGGYGSGTADLGDLWKYHIATNEWTWMNGVQSGSQPTVYGTIGVPSPTNDPGRRQECKSSWAHVDNTLWMFGGVNGAQALNDMWRYDISTNEWTFMKGDMLFNSPGNYGVKGVESPTNLPSARASYTKWKGIDGNFYIFGGSLNGMNDVWRFNPYTNNWTWLSGSNSPLDTGKYISQCDPTNNQIPGARFENQSVFTDGCSQAFWSFGGFKASSMSQGDIYNDLWLYNLSDNSWTWVSGSQATNSTGNIGVMGLEATSNMIEAKGGVGIWSDNNRNLWVFGGYSAGFILSNDLWRFKPYESCFKTSVAGGIAAFQITPTSTDIKSPVFSLQSSSDPTYTLEWYYNGNLISTDPNPTYTATEVGKYCFTLVVKTPKGCVDSITHCAEVVENSFIFVPSAFSPNNDNLNNEVKIISENIQLNVFSIFNRWGEMIFTTKDITKGWNGTYKGQPCEIGTYFYKVEYHVGGKSKLAKGDITLLR